MIIPSQVIVTLANPNLATAAALDPNGVPTGDVKVDRSGPALKVMLPKDALYVVLEAR